MDRSNAFFERARQLGASDVRPAGGGVSGQGRSGFEREARRRKRNLFQLRRELVDNVERYSDTLHGLSDAERDELDARIAAALREEQDAVLLIRKQVLGFGQGLDGSLQAHKQAVVQILHDDVQEVTRLVSELQLLRMRQTVASRKSLFSSEAASDEAARIERLVQADQARDDGLRKRRRGGSVDPAAKAPPSPRDALFSSGQHAKRDAHADRGKRATAIDYGSDSSSESDDELDGALEQQFEEEQKALKAQLDAEQQSVRAAEKQMHEFSQLASFFSDKLFEQSHNIKNIHKDVKESKQYMGKATQELESAKKHGSSFRKYVVIFFSIATGMLLLLDAMD